MLSSRYVDTVMSPSPDRGSESLGSRLAWWFAVALGMSAIVLALPNQGLGAVLREDSLDHGPVEPIKGDLDGGVFSQCRSNAFTSNFFTILYRGPGEENATKILEVWGSRDLFDGDVSTVVDDGGLVVTVVGYEDRPVTIGPGELFWLRWFGPRVVVDGIPRPLWHWSDATDSAFLMVIALILFELLRRRRGGSRG